MELVDRDATRCRPCRYGSDASDAETGIRIGGGPCAAAPDAALRFLCAARAPLRADYVVNIFLGFSDFDTMADNAGVLVHDGRLIHHAIANSMDPVESLARDVWFEPQRYLMEPATSDVIVEVDGSSHFRGGTKLGGTPYRWRPAHFRLFDFLNDDGWRLFLQLAFPAETELCGDWPFNDGLLWAMYRWRGEDMEWGYIWDF